MKFGFQIVRGLFNKFCFIIINNALLKYLNVNIDLFAKSLRILCFQKMLWLNYLLSNPPVWVSAQIFFSGQISRFSYRSCFEYCKINSNAISFVFFPWASEPSMNFKNLTLIYCKIITDIIYFRPFFSFPFFGLRKQPTWLIFHDTTTGFPSKWRLRNKRRNSILMTCHLCSGLGSASG